MRIGVDACCWSNRRGFGRFTRELVAHLVAGAPEHDFLLVVDRATAAACRLPEGAEVCVVDTRAQPTRAASAQGSRSPADLWRLGRAASAQRLDAFFFPAVYSYYPLTRRMPTAVTFHDAIAEQHPTLIFPGLRSRLFWRAKTWLALRQADRVVTVSEAARGQIAAAFGYPEAAIRVIPEGTDPAFRPTADREMVARVLAQYQLPAGCPLILYVGGISPHKNLEGLVRALAREEAVAQAWHLALVGDYADDSFHSCYRGLSDLCRGLGLQGRVTFTGYVPDDHLVALYNAATMLVLPSFSEGFGLPVVEAMACGVPVAASRRGSLPEVLGSAGVLFDPEDHRDITAAILRLLGSPALRERLRSEGLRQVERYSWAGAARQVIDMFEEMAHGAARTA